MTATGTVAQMGTLATHTALSVWTVANDFLILLIPLIILFLFAWYVGRGPLVALLLSFYAGYALYAIFPYFSFFPVAPPMTAFLSHVGLYAVLVFLFYLVIRRVVVSDFLYIGPFGLVLLALAGTVFLVALASHVFLIGSLYQFTPQVAALFVPDKFFFWWMSAPIIGLLFFAR